MSRVGAAFSCFWQLLTTGRLPPEAVDLLPEDALPHAQLPPPEPPAPIPAAIPAEPSRPFRPSWPDQTDIRAEGALTFLSLLQREGRLIDFLRESLDGYDDASIGAAVRAIHRGCKKVVDDHLKLEPVMPGEEETPVTIPRGFDPGQVRLIGRAAGEPPFRGTLVHPGWRAVDVKLPTVSEGVDRRVLAPAEVRVG